MPKSRSTAPSNLVFEVEAQDAFTTFHLALSSMFSWEASLTTAVLAQNAHRLIHSDRIFDRPLLIHNCWYSIVFRVVTWNSFPRSGLVHFPWYGVNLCRSNSGVPEAESSPRLDRHWKVSSYCFLASRLHAKDLPCLNRCLKSALPLYRQSMSMHVSFGSPMQPCQMISRENKDQYLWSLVDPTGTASSISSVHRGSRGFSSSAGRAACDWLCAALRTATSFWICGGFKPNPGRRPSHPSASFLASDKNLQSISKDLYLHSCYS